MEKCICIRQYNQIFKKGKIYDTYFLEGRHCVIRENGAGLIFDVNDFKDMFMDISDYRNAKIEEICG